MESTISDRKIEDKEVRKRVVITGVGCVSPVGNDADASWINILAGKSGVQPVTQFDTSQFKTRIAAEVKDFDAKALLGQKEARRFDRVSQLALVAAREAVEQAGLEITDHNRDRVGVLVGSGIGGRLVGGSHSAVLNSASSRGSEAFDARGSSRMAAAS